MDKKAYLLLENGTIFEGKCFGTEREIVGEVVFTTAMTGYLETLTDPSYYGQIVIQTFPLIGNYGVIPSDFESKSVGLCGYIVREWCQNPSNFRCDGDIDAFLKSENVPGIYGIDTRRLTKIIREYGVMNGKILYAMPKKDDLKGLPDFKIIKAVENVTCKEQKVYSENENTNKKIVLWDFGAKQNIIRELTSRGCEVVTMPATSTAKEIYELNPDGIMLSNGPGDPAENVSIIEELRKLCEKKIPIFGICLGHQLLALSQSAKTGKLKYGHRGANQPVTCIEDGRTYISSQNHGYAVLSDTLPSYAKESFVNANDNTNEGVKYQNMPAFSVQFHPEACGGPHDTSFLFDDFITLINKNKKEN